MRRIDRIFALLDTASVLIDEEANIDPQLPPEAKPKVALLGQLIDSALARAEQLQVRDFDNV